MGTNATTQYTAFCNNCSEMDVLNQGDFSIIFTLKQAKEYWRNEGWKFGTKKAKCPKCSQNRWRNAMKQEALNFMIWLEEQMDNYNGDNGEADRLCCFCGAKKYNSTLGILHKRECAIIKLRKDIAEAKSQTN